MFVRISYPIILLIIFSSCTNQKKTEMNIVEQPVAVSNSKNLTNGFAQVNGIKMYYEIYGTGKPLVEILVQSGLCPSKGQARKDIEGGGVYVNNARETNFQRAVTSSDLLFGKHLLLRKGKRSYVVLTAK